VRRRSWQFAHLCAAVAGVSIMLTMASSASDPPHEPGSGDPSPATASPPGPATLLAALTESRAVEQARIELTTRVNGPDEPFTLVHRGAFTLGGARAQAESDMTAAAAALEESGRHLGGDWTQPTRVVVDGDVVYSQLGPMAESLGRAPTDWAMVPLMTVMAQGVTDNDALALVLDPVGPLDLLEREVVEIAEVGPEPVRGVATTHLRASLALGGPTPDGASGPSPGSFEARLQAAGVDVLPIDVWVDAMGIVRRLRVSLDDALSDLGAATGLTTTYELYDIGTEVHVEVPDPGDVVNPAG